MRDLCSLAEAEWVGLRDSDPVPISVNCQGLTAAQRQDLADVLPYLACGEVSAVHAFSGRLWHQVPSAARTTLMTIAQDEWGHARLIEALQQVLPPPQCLPKAARLRMFFRRMESDQPAEHLAQVAALDRAVCQWLHPMLRPGRAISRAPDLHRALCALRQDEARHVRMARNMAQQLGMPATRQAWLNHTIGLRLAKLLQPVRPALQRLAGDASTASWVGAA